MKKIVESRASVIIYNFIKSNFDKFEGKKVVLPANVCPILPVILMKAGVAFDFLDISVQTLCIDQNILKDYVRANPKDIACIFYVRTFGFIEEDTASLFKDIKELNNNILIVDDRCAGIPETECKEFASADMLLYSTGYAKYVEFSWGGYCFLSDNLNYNKTNIPFSSKDHDLLVQEMNHSILYNSPFIYTDRDWLGGDEGNTYAQDYFEKITNRKKEIAVQKKQLNDIYSSILPADIQLSVNFQNWRFSILVQNKKQVLDEIFKAGLFASSHYSSISHLFGGAKADNAINIHSRIVNLFNDFRFTPEMAAGCAKIVKNSYEG